MNEFSIDKIDVGSRHRKDMGDIKRLADSISEVGLLHPVVITPKGTLIAGERRLRACDSRESTPSFLGVSAV